MDTISPPRTCTCGQEATCRKAQERAAAYPGAPEPTPWAPQPDHDEPRTVDLDWLDPLDESEFDALRLAWAFMQ